MVFSPSGKQQTALIVAGTACAVLDIIVWSIGMMTYTPLCYLLAILFAIAATVTLTMSYGIGTCKDRGKLLVKVATSALCLAILSALPAMSYVTLLSGSVGYGAAAMCAVFYICALVAFGCVSTALDRMPDGKTTITKVASDVIPMTDGDAANATPMTSDEPATETATSASECSAAPESDASPSDSAAADSTQRKYPSGRFRMHMQVVDSDRSISGSNAHRVWFKEEGHSFYGQRTEGYVLLDSGTWEIIPKSRPITGNSNFYAMTYEDYDAYCKKNGIEPYPDGAFDEPEKDADGVIIGPAKSTGEKTEAGSGDGSEQATAETVATKRGRLTPEELEALMRDDLEKMTREVAFKRLQAIGVIDENGNPTYRFSDSDDGDDGSDSGDAAPNPMPEGKTIFTAEHVDEAMSGGTGDSVATDTDDDGTTSDARDDTGSDVIEGGAEDSKVPDTSDGDADDVAPEAVSEETMPDTEPETAPEPDAEPADEKPHYDADTQFLCEVVTACGERFTYPVSCGSVESIVRHENPELSFFSDRAFSEPVDWSKLNPDNRTVYAKTTGRKHVLFLHVLDEDSEPIVRRLVVNDGKSLASVIRTPRQTNRGEFFEAWYSDAGLNRRMQLRRPVIGDMSLYAKYDAPVR